MTEKGTAAMGYLQVAVYIVSTLWLLQTLDSVSAACVKEFNYNGSRRSYANCANLQSQGASIAWSYRRRSKNLAVAFSGHAILENGWVGWGINPKCSQMVGTSALIAYRAVNGSTVLPYQLKKKLLTSNALLRCTPVDVDFQHTSVDIRDSEITIFTTVQLEHNQTNIRLVWNRGPFVMDFYPLPHLIERDSLPSVAILDIHSGPKELGVLGCPVPDTSRSQKKKHAWIGGIGWGVLYPMGVVLGWFTLCHSNVFLYVYIPYHLLSFGVGMAGYYSGSMLGDLDGAEHSRNHHILAVAIVIFGTLQLLLCILRVASVNGCGGLLVRHVKTSFCSYNFVIAFVNFFFIAAEIYGGIRLLMPGYRWDPKWLIISCLAFALYICNCAGMKRGTDSVGN